MLKCKYIIPTWDRHVRQRSTSFTMLSHCWITHALMVNYISLITSYWSYPFTTYCCIFSISNFNATYSISFSITSLHVISCLPLYYNFNHVFRHSRFSLKYRNLNLFCWSKVIMSSILNLCPSSTIHVDSCCYFWNTNFFSTTTYSFLEMQQNFCALPNINKILITSLLNDCETNQ